VEAYVTAGHTFHNDAHVSIKLLTQRCSTPQHTERHSDVIFPHTLLNIMPVKGDRGENIRLLYMSCTIGCFTENCETVLALHVKYGLCWNGTNLELYSPYNFSCSFHKHFTEFFPKVIKMNMQTCRWTANHDMTCHVVSCHIVFTHLLHKCSIP
jgi:hypothetical protein